MPQQQYSELDFFVTTKFWNAWLCQESRETQKGAITMQIHINQQFVEQTGFYADKNR